jgi:cyclic-di-GMP-binding protein
MPSESNFDIVSKIDRQEVDNALNRAAEEIAPGSISAA